MLIWLYLFGLFLARFGAAAVASAIKAGYDLNAVDPKPRHTAYGDTVVLWSWIIALNSAIIASSSSRRWRHHQVSVSAEECAQEPAV